MRPNRMRRLAAILAVTVLCGSLCACGNTSTASDTTPTTTVPTDTEPTAAPLAAVDIDTIGGAVLIGEIGLDDNGWHFLPEQPLNITFRFSEDTPSVFPEQTRIAMFDPKDDGISKTVYLGKTVTVGGTFSFLRDDFETLYFLPYTITAGKIADSCYAAPDLTYPDEPENLFDPSKPLPASMATTVQDGHYVYNPYKLSQETLDHFGNEFADFYEDFVNAFLHYEPSFPCPQERFAEMLETVIIYEFPMYHACAEPFEFFKHYDAETGTATIVYRYDEAEHQRLIAQITDEANDMLAAASPDTSDTDKARSLYHALASRMTYDHSAMVDLERKECCYAYLNHSGVCITFANVYNQLLTQMDILTTVAACDDGAEGHAWSAVTLDGQQYFCDPTYELSHDNGNGYRYFGMNYTRRTANGLGANGIYLGRYRNLPADPADFDAASLSE